MEVIKYIRGIMDNTETILLSFDIAKTLEVATLLVTMILSFLQGGVIVLNFLRGRKERKRKDAYIARIKMTSNIKVVKKE